MNPEDYEDLVAIFQAMEDAFQGDLTLTIRPGQRVNVLPMLGAIIDNVPVEEARDGETP